MSFVKQMNPPYCEANAKMRKIFTTNKRKQKDEMRTYLHIAHKTSFLEWIIRDSNLQDFVRTEKISWGLRFLFFLWLLHIFFYKEQYFLRKR